MEERVELHIMFLADPVVGSENGMFTIHLNGTRIVGVDPIGFKIAKEVTVTVNRKQLLDILGAGETDRQGDVESLFTLEDDGARHEFVQLLSDEDLEALRTDGNALARRVTHSDLSGPPNRFPLGHLQALYEYIFRAGMPRLAVADPVEHGYWVMSNAYWHGRRGGRFAECLAHPGTCAHAAYQAGYDTGVRGQFEKGVGPIADVARYFEFEKERATWHCGECEKPWPSFKEAHACCAKRSGPYYCTVCGMNTVDAEGGFDTCAECLKNV